MRALVAILPLVAALLSPCLAQGQTQEAETATRSTKGAVIGGLAGSVLGGLAFGLMAESLCDGDCGQAFQEGFLIGAVGGGLFGGLTGMVVGAAIPAGVGGEDPAPRGRWEIGVTGGPRWAGPSTMRGLGTAVAVRAFRSTTSRVLWGLEGAYLGSGSSTTVINGHYGDGSPFTVTLKRRESLWALSLVALRLVGGKSRAYVMASAGAYPTYESTSSVRTPVGPDSFAPPRVSDRSWGGLPGVSLGAGGLFVLGRRLDFGGESRLHLIPGAGDESILPLVSLSGSLRYRRG